MRSASAFPLLVTRRFCIVSRSGREPTLFVLRPDGVAFLQWSRAQLPNTPVLTPGARSGAQHNPIEFILIHLHPLVCCERVWRDFH
jgi:hypothetical protein